MRVVVLSGGAAHGLVDALASDFKARTGADIDAMFGAVGAMKERLLTGTPADLLILTQALIGELAGSGHVVRRLGAQHRHGAYRHCSPDWRQASSRA